MMEYDSMVKNKEKSKVLARIVAHLMGDGCVTDKYFAYYNKSQVLLDIFEKDIISFFGELHFTRGKVNSGTSLLQIQSKKIIYFLRTLINDYRSFNLRIPKFINNKNLRKEFLRAIYDDEGCVGLRIFKKTNEIKRNLEIASKSKKFLEDIKKVLEKDFDIETNKIISFRRNLNGKEFVTWKLSITGKENFIKFRENINFTHPDKIKRLILMINSYLKK